MKSRSNRLRLAQVIVPKPVRKLFTYEIPVDMADKIRPGVRALVPFGSRALIGLIAGITDKTDLKTKPILQALDNEPVVSPDMLALALWTADYYFAPPGDVLPLITPRNSAVVETVVELDDSFKPSDTAPARVREVFDALVAKGGARKLHLLAGDIGLTPGELKKLLTTSAVRRFTRLVQSSRLTKPGRLKSTRAGAVGEKTENAEPATLTQDQQKAVNQVAPDITAGRFKTYLLHGVTGSGKTEVYASLAQTAIENGKSVLALAPEIALSALVARRFAKRLNAPVVVLHSGLKPSQRAQRWKTIAEQTPVIVAGARSAVFAPVNNLGLVIVDEEHDPSYKQDESPRYNGRDVAVKRGSIENAPVLLGTATPSMESYHNAVRGKYGLIELAERIDGRPMPDMETVAPENEYAIGRTLRDGLRERLEKGEQTLLFLNRRGAARYVRCSRCGHVFHCPNCSISLVYHSHSGTMMCHTCDYRQTEPTACAECGSGKLREGGMGTQKISAEIRRLFPQANIARMDRDTTTKRGARSAILHAMDSRRVDILIGTQMVTKGHDYHGITLVGIVSADDTLYTPDFRASERTFQQITQAAGRAGRGNLPGSVVVQTSSAFNHGIKSAVNHDFARFYKTELVHRKTAGYPPFTRLARITVSASSEGEGEDYLLTTGPVINRLRRRYPAVAVLGPATAAVFKVRNRYRWRLLFKSRSMRALRSMVSDFLDALNEGKLKSAIKLSVDIDPADSI